MATRKIVKVSVKGGVLSVDRLPEGVEVELTEYDNGEIVDFVKDPRNRRIIEVLVGRV